MYTTIKLFSRYIFYIFLRRILKSHYIFEKITWNQLTNFQILSLTWFLGSVTYTGAGWILSGPTLESIFCRVISHKWKSHMILFAKKKWRYKFSWIVSLAPLFCSCFAILIKQWQAMTWRPSFWPCKKVLLSPSEWHWKKKSSITQNACKNIKISL